MSDHSAFEASFWGDCRNTYNEETKQLLYMRLIGFEAVRDWRTPWNFDMKGRSVVDIGGGPSSILLKCHHRGVSLVVDPMKIPEWAVSRYALAGILYSNLRGEELSGLDHDGVTPTREFDMALIYNCLQHTEDPAKVIANARHIARDLAMFEWIDVPTHEGHPHELTEEKLNEWTGRKGLVRKLTGENECWGTAWVLPPVRP